MRIGWSLYNDETGQILPARCGRNGCDYCLPLNAVRRARAVAMMLPKRTLTLTNVADSAAEDPWQQARVNINRTREYLKRSGVDPGSWATFVERGSKTGMVHAHIAQTGSRPIPKDVLQECAHRAGIGWTRIEAVRKTGDLSRYVGKGFGIAGYGVKTFGDDAETDPREALRLNGGRIGHFSRGFFLSAAGAKLPVREAEKLAARLARESRDEGGRWVLIREALAPLAPSPA